MNMENESYDFLFFNLEEEKFAIEVSNIIEVLELNQITEIPQSPDFIKGVTNFRGDILPVIDTHHKLNIEKTNEKTIIIILNLEQNNTKTLIGITANNVSNVNNVTKDDIKPLPEISAKIKKEYLKGMIKKDRDIVFIIDINKAFSIAELSGDSSLE